MKKTSFKFEIDSSIPEKNIYHFTKNEILGSGTF